MWSGASRLFGGLFLVRYSIEQNLLTPAMRIVFGGLFAVLLAGAGEWLRRRDRRVALPGIPNANCRSVLTAAGTCTAFASVYAAYALYDRVGPGLAFVLLGPFGFPPCRRDLYGVGAGGGLGLVCDAAALLVFAASEHPSPSSSLSTSPRCLPPTGGAPAALAPARHRGRREAPPGHCDLAIEEPEPSPP